MQPHPPIAHIRVDQGQLLIHPLDTHSFTVSRLAAEFAAAFSASGWACWAGGWHDLGKFREGFQRYILQCNDPNAHIEGRVQGKEKTHSAAGALWAQEYFPAIDPKFGPLRARVLAYLIAGHHAGLDDWFGGLEVRLGQQDAKNELADALRADIPPDFLKPDWPLPDMQAIRAEKPGDIPGRFALWVRMLFSCLVDADFLNTEAFMSPEKTEAREKLMSLAEMESRLAQRLEKISKLADDTAVNKKRAEVLQNCLDKAELPPGIFTLTVPTGGGKTLSSLAFALRHARLHKKRRVIYAIPYTSIIEQTAAIFREIFGEENVVEHHSNIEVDEQQETQSSRLACENWAAPLIVTTNVQLLESLFARRTSRCRKLHNLVGSVIILDEAQLLPVDYLQPVIDVLRLLVQDYGVTLVLCTATQPALITHERFDKSSALRGFAANESREIMGDVSHLYAALKRVRFHLPADFTQRQSWETLAPEIAAHEAVLAIVGRRRDARELYTALKKENSEGLWHLSGLMCAKHRRDTIAAIKAALLARWRGESTAPIRVVSTQLVEAGVDIDFPVVYRALAGLDSIAQAAGRCNREGLLEYGDVHVFIPPHDAPSGLLRQAAQATTTLWRGLQQGADPMGVECFPEFFHKLYTDAKLDTKGICDLLRVKDESLHVGFHSAAENFRLIDEADGATVFVRYQAHENDGSFDKLLSMLKQKGPERWLLRQLQGYGVSIYRHDLERLIAQGDVLALPGDLPGLYAQNGDLLYDPTLGVNVDGAPGDPGRLVF